MSRIPTESHKTILISFCPWPKRCQRLQPPGRVLRSHWALWGRQLALAWNSEREPAGGSAGGDDRLSLCITGLPKPKQDLARKVQLIKKVLSCFTHLEGLYFSLEFFSSLEAGWEREQGADLLLAQGCFSLPWGDATKS